MLSVIKRTVGRKKQHTSHLTTEVVRLKLDPSNPALLEVLSDWNNGFEVDHLLLSVRSLARDFLLENGAPEPDVTNFNIVSLKHWVDGHHRERPGILEACSMLADLHAFESDRKSRSEVAYARLLRLVHNAYALAVARLEVGFFAGRARNGHTEKTAEMHRRQQAFLQAFYTLMDEGRGVTNAKRIAMQRLGVSRSTVARWFTNTELEKLYHTFTQ